MYSIFYANMFSKKVINFKNRSQITAPQTAFRGNDFEASFLDGADQRDRYLAPAWYPQELVCERQTFLLAEGNVLQRR